MMNKPPTMHERRRQKRRNISYYMPILDPGTLQVVGHLVDINQIGFMIDCPVALIGGVEMDLRLDTPPGISNKDFILFHARVKWCRPDRITPNSYNVGFEIIGISESDAGIIQSIAEQFGSR
jgi:hypothetical protein